VTAVTAENVSDIQSKEAAVPPGTAASCRLELGD
jgi:hypothetical protein